MRAVGDADDNLNQVRAKAVLLRDLEELRAKRYALENPTNDSKEVSPVPNTAEQPPELSQDIVTTNESLRMTPQPEVKLEKIESESNGLSENKPLTESVEDPTKEATAKLLEDNTAQGPSPPSSANPVDVTSNPTGLITDTSEGNNDTSPTKTGIQDAAIDSLFEMPDDDGNNQESALNFDTMDFSFQDPNGNTQNQDHSQPQNSDFDLSTFGNASDFSMPDLQASNDAILGDNANSKAVNNPVDGLFGSGDNNGGGDNMDLDIDLSMVAGPDSLFDDMFFGSGDNENLDIGDEMKHGEFDNAFFGLDD